MDVDDWDVEEEGAEIKRKLAHIQACMPGSIHRSVASANVMGDVCLGLLERKDIMKSNAVSKSKSQQSCDSLPSKPANAAA